MEFLLRDVVEPEAATGKIDECYKKLDELVGQVHDEFKIFSVSPTMFASQIAGMEYLATHSRLKPMFWTLLRYLVSVKYKNRFCMIFNIPIMKKEGISDEVIDKMTQDHDLIPCENPEKELLKFVLKLIDNPNSIDKTDISDLKKLGWSESDIFEASIAGARHIAIDIIFTGFIRYE